MGRKHVKRNGQLVLAYKGWRDLTNSQKEWIFNQLHASYQNWCNQNEKTKLSRSEESNLVDKVVTQVVARGISVNLREVEMQCRARLRKYERNSLKKQYANS